MPITHKEFGAKTGAIEAAAAFAGEIRGKTVLITGVSPDSIGSGLAFALASQAPSLLIIASRTLAKIQAVSQTIHAAYPSTRIREVSVELSSQASVRSAATEIQRIVQEVNPGGGIDVLFNNAGINISDRKLSPEGYELQFATNHLGPFLLTNLLLPLFAQQEHYTVRKRIVNTSSEAHRISPVRFSDINQVPGAQVLDEDGPRRGLPEGMLRADGRYEPPIAYGSSKTANILMSVELNAILGPRARLRSFAVMPGTIMTGLVRGLDAVTLKGMLHNTTDEDWKTHDQGAATLVIAGFDPALDDEPGVYLEDCQMRRPSKWATDPAKAERLWSVSEEMVGQKFSYGVGKRSQL